MNNMLIEIENEKLNLSASVNSVTYKGDRVPESGKSGHICSVRLTSGI